MEGSGWAVWIHYTATILTVWSGKPKTRSREGTVYHSILREIGFKKNLSSRVVRTECARRNGWAGPGFGKKLSWSRENEVWLALSVREE